METEDIENMIEVKDGKIHNKCPRCGHEQWFAGEIVPPGVRMYIKCSKCGKDTRFEMLPDAYDFITKQRADMKKKGTASVLW